MADLPFVHQCTLRWFDMDAYGHVNNAAFVTLYEEARIALLFAGAREVGVGSLEGGIVIARQEIDYLRPVNYADPVRIELWLEKLSAGRFTVGYELYAADALAGRARTVCVPFDLATARPRRLTEVERDFLQQWLVAP